MTFIEMYNTVQHTEDWPTLNFKDTNILDKNATGNKFTANDAKFE